jgi:3-dehydroquinate synthase
MLNSPSGPAGMISRKIQLAFEHRTFFTRKVFDPENATLASCLSSDPETPGEKSSALVFVDEGLIRANVHLIERITHYFQQHAGSARLAAPPIVLPGGEACKNDWSQVESIWRSIHGAGLCRHSYVLAMGGGALLDLVGFAAATAHRGIRHIRLPTTTLSLADGGVGVKNGVNRFGKKNWIGTFTVPHAIIGDFDLLRYLPERDLRAGLIEVVKVALIRDASLFEALEARLDSLARLEEPALEFAIRRSAELHMNHIALAGDPFELGSARPLDFGHWAAHKLEQLSGFRLRHGEAVAIGMAIDLLYARNLGWLSATDCERILRLIEKLGFHLFAAELSLKAGKGLAILEGLEEFREHLGGQLTVTLVNGIGSAFEVHDMDTSALPGVFAELQERFMRKGVTR